MTLDNEGNLYLTGKVSPSIDPAGNRIGNIPVTPAGPPTYASGGKDRSTLFITASESVYTLRMKVKE